MQNVILLALVAAVYPTLLAGVVLILSRPQPFRMLIGFLAGGMTISVIVGFGIVRTLESTGAVAHSNHTSRPVIDIVAGVLSLVLAWAIETGHIKLGKHRHKREREAPRADDHRQAGAREAAPQAQCARAHPGDDHSSWTSRALSRSSVAMAFIAGLVLNLPGVWYLDALTEIAHAKPSVVSALLQILVFNLIMLALVEIPIVLYVTNPRRASAAVTTLSVWLHDHSHSIAVVLATGVGLWLLAKGIVNLVS